MNDLNLKKKQIELTLERAVNSSKSSAKAIKLREFSDICEALVEKKVQLKITLIVKYMLENGHKLSEQSVYNKQKGGNPYRELFDLWNDYQTTKHNLSDTVVNTQAEISLIDESDLKQITDPALRYRINLMLGEVKGLKKQNDLLKQVKDMNVIQTVSDYMIESKDQLDNALNEYDLEVLEELFSSNSFVKFSENGALISNLAIKKGQALSNPGLKEALLKVLNSHSLKD